MDFNALIKTVAPWIGTALAGPLGGMAVTAAADALGLSDKTVDSVKQAITGADGVVGITRAINGGLIGLAEHKQLLAKAKAAAGI